MQAMIHWIQRQKSAGSDNLSTPSRGPPAARIDDQVELSKIAQYAQMVNFFPLPQTFYRHSLLWC